MIWENHFTEKCFFFKHCRKASFWTSRQRYLFCELTVVDLKETKFIWQTDQKLHLLSFSQLQVIFRKAVVSNFWNQICACIYHSLPVVTSFKTKDNMTHSLWKLWLNRFLKEKIDEWYAKIFFSFWLNGYSDSVFCGEFKYENHFDFIQPLFQKSTLKLRIFNI